MKLLGPFHDSVFRDACRRRPDVRYLQAVDGLPATELAFRISDASKVAECLFGGDPILTQSPNLDSRGFLNALKTLSQNLGRTVYFPLVDRGGHSYRLLSRMDLTCWARLPAPQILGTTLDSGLVARAEQRLGTRAKRRLRRFRESKAVIRTLHGDEAINCILTVEASSWKAGLGQDMRSRDQAWIYDALARSQHTLVRVAAIDSLPIAYRLDYLFGRVLYCLKWSYNESYRRLSPGFFLMTQDLADCWAGRRIERVNLHGSVDSLKATLADSGHDLERYDFAWSGHADDIIALRSEREAHDLRTVETYEHGLAIRHAYQQS